MAEHAERIEELEREVRRLEAEIVGRIYDKNLAIRQALRLARAIVALPLATDIDEGAQGLAMDLVEVYGLEGRK